MASDDDAELQEDEYIVDEDLGYDDYGDEVEAYDDDDDPEAYYEAYEEEDFDPYGDDEETPLSPEEERMLLEGCSLEELREMCVETELDSSGDKEALLDRLLQAVRDEEAEEAEEAEMRGRQVMAAVRSADVDEATALGAAAAAPAVAKAVSTNTATAHWGTPDPIGVATLEAAALSPEADPAAYARLEAYVVAWATHETQQEKYATHKWLRHMRRGIRTNLCTLHDDQPPQPPPPPPSPSPSPPLEGGGREREGGTRPALVDEEALLRCLERMGEEGKLPAGEAGAKLAAATGAFRQRHVASAAARTLEGDDDDEGRGGGSGRRRGGSGQQSGARDMTCSNCGARGHAARDCPSPPRRMVAQQQQQWRPQQGRQQQRQEGSRRTMAAAGRQPQWRDGHDQRQGRRGGRSGVGDGAGDGVGDGEDREEEEGDIAPFGLDDLVDDGFDGRGGGRYERDGRGGNDDRGGRGGYDDRGGRGGYDDRGGRGSYEDRGGRGGYDDRGGRGAYDDRGGRGARGGRGGDGLGSPSRQQWSRGGDGGGDGGDGGGDGGDAAGYGRSHRGGRGRGVGGGYEYGGGGGDGGDNAAGYGRSHRGGRGRGHAGGGDENGGDGRYEEDDSLFDEPRRDRRPPRGSGGGGGGYSPLADRVCYNCGRRGHIAVHCPLPRRDQRDAAAVNSYQRGRFRG